MSMIGNFLRVSNDELNKYLDDSTLLEDRVYSESSDLNDPNLIDIDKTWDGILYLLTGNTLDEIDSADPTLSSIIIGKNTLDENQDMGYGPANYNTAEEVKEIAKILDAIPSSKLKEKFDPKKMMELEIYPTMWDEPNVFEYVEDYYEKLRDFYKTAAKNNQAVLTFVN